MNGAVVTIAITVIVLGVIGLEIYRYRVEEKAKLEDREKKIQAWAEREREVLKNNPAYQGAKKIEERVQDDYQKAKSKFK